MPSINLGRVRGDKGTSMRNRGEWNSALKYVNDKDYIDLVSHNGSLWTCIATNTNVEPSNDALEWNLTAKSIDTVYFEQAQRRENIASGESAETVFGKIARWFSDFKDAAFYNVVNGVSQTKAGEAVLDAAVGKYLDEKKLDISKVIASRAITEYGFVMDGKTIADWLSELNSKIFVVAFANAKNNDMIPLGRTVDRSGFVFPLPRWNTGSTIKCIFATADLQAGDTEFKLSAYDTATGTGSTSTSLNGRAIVILP